MQLGPDARTRTPHEQAYGFATVAEGQHEQSRPAVFAGLGMPHHRTRPVINLTFLSYGGEDYSYSFELGSAELANKTLYRLIAADESVVGNQVLPDGRGVPAAAQSLLDQLAIRFTGTGGLLWMVGRRTLVS